MFEQVSRQAERPNFQAGHAGSIPVIRSQGSVLVSRFFRCSNGACLTERPARVAQVVGWPPFGPTNTNPRSPGSANRSRSDPWPICTSASLPGRCRACLPFLSVLVQGQAPLPDVGKFPANGKPQGQPHGAADVDAAAARTLRACGRRGGSFSNHNPDQVPGCSSSVAGDEFEAAAQP
jgi:hypothetical protein